MELGTAALRRGHHVMFLCLWVPGGEGCSVCVVVMELLLSECGISCYPSIALPVRPSLLRLSSSSSSGLIIEFGLPFHLLSASAVSCRYSLVKWATGEASALQCVWVEMEDKGFIGESHTSALLRRYRWGEETTEEKVHPLNSEERIMFRLELLENEGC